MERCEKTDLYPSDCAHCRGLDWRKVITEELPREWDDPHFEPLKPGARDKAYSILLPCPECEFYIFPTQSVVQSDSGETVHKDCS